MSTSHLSMPTSVNESEEVPSKRKCSFSWKKALVTLVIAAFIVYLIVDSFTTKFVIRISQQFLEATERLGVLGIFIFALVYILATVFLIPGAILTIGAGFVFTKTNGGNQAIGTAIATAAVFVGATVGSTIAYLVAKHFLRETIGGWAKKYRLFYAIDKAIESNGLKIVFLLRLSPVLPYNVLNYLLGITSLSLRDYVIACLGFIPGTAAFCFIGSTLGSLTDVVSNDGSNNTGMSRTVRLVILIIGIVASVLAVVAITFYARRELKKHLDEEKQDDESKEDQESDDIESGRSEPQVAENERRSLDN